MERNNRADVVVIGGGLAGAAAARVLADAGLDVIIVDAGLQLSPTFARHVAADARLDFGTPARERLVAGLLAPIANAPGAAPQMRAELAVALPAGGAGTLWTGIAERLDAVDEPARAFAGTAIEPCYAQAERLLGVEAGGSSPAFAVDSARFRLLRTASVGARRSTTGPADILMPAAKVPILAGRLALRLEHAGGRVGHVITCDVSTGTTAAIAADQFVVAADAIRSPALLAASGILPEPGFPVGQWLADHPLALARIEASTDAGRALAKSLGVGTDVASLGVVRLGGPAGIHALVLAPAQQRSSPDAAPILHLYWYGLGWPRPGNGLVFSQSSSCSTFGTFDVQAAMREPVAEPSALQALQADLAAVANSLGRALPGWRPRLLPLGAAMHCFGTLRTAVGGPGVTDAWGRVDSFDNLHVAGTARLPFACSVNPALAAVALAIATAQAISGGRALAPAASHEAGGRTAPTD